MALPSFVATGVINEILGEIASDELVQDAATRAVIQLTSNWPSDVPLVWQGEINWLKQPVLARVNTSGEVVNEYGDPLRLLARHPDLVENLQWRITIDLPPSVLPPKPGERLRSWTIDAGEDGDIVDLATAVPAITEQGVVSARGESGLGFGGFYITSSGLVQPMNTLGQPVGSPVAMEADSLSSIDGGTPFSNFTGG